MIDEFTAIASVRLQCRGPLEVSVCATTSLAPLSTPAVMACDREDSSSSVPQVLPQHRMNQFEAVMQPYLCLQRLPLKRLQVSGPREAQDVRHV